MAFWKTMLAGCTLVLSIFGAQPAFSQQLDIRETTKFYRITGKTAGQFAASMSRKGPYSRSHGRRAWATAARLLSYQIKQRRTLRRCSVQSVNVKMQITYTMPKLRTLSGVSRRNRAKWQQMYGLLNRHEKTHGRFYREFAVKVHRSLRRLKPARNCRTLKRNAAAVLKRLGEEDRRRNLAFDARDGKSYRRMSRLLSS